MSWFQQHGPTSPTPYGVARPSPTPYTPGRMSPTPYQGATRPTTGASRGMGGFLAAPFANPFGKEKRGAVKDILTSPNPFGSKARGAVGTVTGLWGGGQPQPQGGTVRASQPPMTIGAMAGPVTMRGPDGSTRQVPLTEVQRYTALGAQVVR